MGKNIVICCDGTDNKFGSKNTNVVRLYQSLDLSDPQKQIAYYDPGVGTIAEPGLISKLDKRWSRFLGSAFGRSLMKDVEEAYAYLMDYYEPDDRIFLFGFSRGAYTVRVLAGLLHGLGLLPSRHNNLIPYATRIFRAINDDEDNDTKKDYWRISGEFRETFSIQRRPCTVHFVGIWDTVSSVGWVWDPKVFPFTFNNPDVKTLRHALAIDERRCFFRQNLWKNPLTSKARAKLVTDVRQIWFPGVHSDIGGGYPTADGGLWVAPLLWITREAKIASLLVDRQRFRNILNPVMRSVPTWKSPQHEELKGKWHIAEVFPKRKRGFAWFKFGLWGQRSIPNRALIHWTALARLRCAKLNYRPKNLSSRFVEEVQQLSSLPRVYEYRK